MKIKIDFDINKKQFEEIIQGVGYAEEIFDPESKGTIPNPMSKKDAFENFMRENVASFIEIFVKQRIHTKLKKEEIEIGEKELKPIVDKMTIDIK